MRPPGRVSKFAQEVGAELRRAGLVDHLGDAELADAVYAVRPDLYERAVKAVRERRKEKRTK